MGWMAISKQGGGTGRRVPVGAELQPGGGVHFRVWCPKHREVAVVSGEGQVLAGLEPEGEGYFSGFASGASGETRYRYQLDGGPSFPDPASRFQPDGPHGPSAVIDPSSFEWTDSAWRGLPLRGQVIYEMHIGTFTREGTWAAAAAQLEELASAGITVLELMPVAEFPGRFGWGYDGVDLFAPTWLYGQPDDFRRFVDAAHARGMAVILDVVYNHFGPDGCYLREFSDHYFSTRYSNEWGDAVNFDGEQSGPVREFFLANAAYWIREFHLDGLRLDATQQIFDSSPEYIVAAIGKAVREAAGGRGTILIAENEPQDVRLIQSPGQGGYGLDGAWNDDYHHSAMVALTGCNEAYYSDYSGRAPELAALIRRGFLYQGQYYSWQKGPRGTPSPGLPSWQYVLFLQNHDQVANSLRGYRIHLLTSPARLRAMTALTLLAPGTPMLFQGQEFAASAPFLYFADQRPELSKKVRDGRLEFLSQFPGTLSEEGRAVIADPGNPATFERCRLDFAEREQHKPMYTLHRDLLALRRDDRVLSLAESVDAAALNDECLVLRWFGGGDDRILLVNLGADSRLRRMNESLLAPPHGRRWAVKWSSENPVYDGSGIPDLCLEENWRVVANSAVLLAAEIRESDR